MTHNQVLDGLILEAYLLFADVEKMKNVLDACPNCRVKYADMVKGLDETSDMVMGVIAKLNGLKLPANEDGKGCAEHG